MYFKRLEVFGFKSFADKTVLNFEPGITAIVGPNGCGKSNIFDSIRWVLGEQSVKELRGSSMEDVIFNGTDKKPGLGFAEVSLTFSNESRMLPVDENEVTITRRLFRSGESEYLLNKTTARLKDIIELFMGTGIGAEAYSLIQQGKVDLVVSARPEDRRIILDEAAGITKYKSKKKEALNKLKDTDNNLLRINDIIIEVKRQIATIERQASKARRYKEEFEKLKAFEIHLAHHELGQFKAQYEALKNKLQEFKDREVQLTQEVEEFNNLIAHQTTLLEEMDEKINEINGEAIKLDGQIDIDSRQIEFNHERLENIRVNEERIAQQKEQLLERCRAQQEKIESMKQVMVSLEAINTQNKENLQEKKNHQHSITELIRDAKEKIQQDEIKILEITSKQVHVKNKLTDIMKELQGALARKRRLELEHAKVTTEKTEVDTKLQTVSQKIQEVTRKIHELKTEEDSRNKTLEELKAQFNILEQKIDDLEKKKLSLISQKEFIEKLHVQYQDIPDPIVEGRFLTTTPPLDHHTGIIGKVKKVTTVDPNGPVYEITCETKFIELDPQQISGKIEELSREIEQNIQWKTELELKIEGERIQATHIADDIHEQEKSLSIFESQNNDVLAEFNKLLQELELTDTEIVEVNESYATLTKTEYELSAQLTYQNQDLDWCHNHIKEKQEFIAIKTQEREEVNVTIAQVEAEMSSFQDKLKGHQENYTMFTEALDGSLAEIKKLDEENTDFGGKKEQFSNEIAALEVKIEELKEKKESFKTVLSDNLRQKEDLAQRINSVRANVTSYDNEVEQIRQDMHNQALAEQEIFYKEKEIKDRLWQAYKYQVDQPPAPVVEAAPAEQAAVAEIPVSQEAQSTDQPVVAEAVPAEVQAEVVQPAPVVEPPPAIVIQLSPEELVVEIERLRKRCDSFGAVNLVAIEEFEQLRERFEFLTKQQSDLITAKDSLMQTITKINRTTRQMFMETFTKVSEEFRIYFRMLFGGGEAQLVLLDPENVLECGIEIIARPPGKKLQNISLLSGGEKSLTAIALVFGVFKVRPSPFCVLDEIDAALDESNVGRFSYLLKDFAKIAQFIVITHNKKTIGSADAMYGITMQETGVSKIVSVKFTDKDKNKEEEPAVAGAV